MTIDRLADAKHFYSIAAHEDINWGTRQLVNAVGEIIQHLEQQQRHAHATHASEEWFITTDKLNQGGKVIAGPFSTFDDARMARTAIEKLTQTYTYWIDTKETADA